MDGSRRALAFMAALAVLALSADVEAASDPLEGAWRLNLEKSNFKSPIPPRGQLRTYRLSNGVETMTARGVNAEGKPTLVKYKARYDGQDYDITGSTGGDKITLRRVDAFTTESVQKRDDQAVITAIRKVSSDRKTLTVTTKGSLPDGQVIDAVMVFDKSHRFALNGE
jgi:hypothetical protein